MSFVVIEQLNKNGHHFNVTLRSAQLRGDSLLCLSPYYPVCNFHGVIILKVKAIYLADLLRLPIFVMLLKDVTKR